MDSTLPGHDRREAGIDRSTDTTPARGGRTAPGRVVVVVLLALALAATGGVALGAGTDPGAAGAPDHLAGTTDALAGASATLQTGTATNVTSCTTIDAPGTYAIGTNITTDSTDRCIEITASDVTLDGQGNTVETNQTGIACDGFCVNRYRGGTAVAVAQATNVTVRNVTVADGHEGLVVDGASGVVVENLTARTNGNQSAPDTGFVEERGYNYDTIGYGMLLQGTNLTVRNSTVETSGGWGILAEGSATTLTVRDTDIDDSDLAGIKLNGGLADASVADGVLDGNGVAGGVSGIDAFADGVTFENVAVSGSGDNGFYLAGSNLLVRNSSVSNNPGDGLSVPGDATGTALDLDGRTVPSFALADATLSRVDQPPTPPANATGLGTFVEVTDNGGSPSANVTLPYTEPNGPENRVALWTYDGDWSKYGGARNASANTVTLGAFPGGPVVAPLYFDGTVFEPTIDTTNSPVVAGTNVTVNVTVENTGATTGTRTVNLTANGGVVDSETLTLDPNATASSTLTWNTSGTPAGFYTVAAATRYARATETVTVTSDTVSECKELVVSDTYRLTGNLTSTDSGDCLTVSASNVTLDGMGYTVDAGPGGSGIHVDGSVANVTVRNLTVENGSTGISTDGALLVETVTVENAGTQGIDAGSNTDVPLTVRHSTITGSGEEGLFADASNVTIVGTTVADSGADGVEVLGATLYAADNTFDGNAQSAFSDGFRASVGEATVLNNTVVNNGGDGIYIVASGEGLRLRNNTARNNSVDGIKVAGDAEPATVEGDRVSGNGAVGIDLDMDNGASGTAVSLNGTRVAAFRTAARPAQDALSPVGSVPAPPPNTTVRGSVIDAVSGNRTLSITLPYQNTGGQDLGVGIYRYAGGSWSPVSGDRNATADTVTAENLSYNGIYGVLYSTDPAFDVTVTGTNSPVAAGTNATVTARVENVGGGAGNATVNLTADGSVVDSVPVSLSSGENTTVTLVWNTTGVDDSYYPVSVSAGSGSDTATVGVGSTEVTDCETLTVPGTYPLGANLTSTTSGDCLTIDGSGVAVDGMGYTVDGGPGGRAVSIAAANVTVRSLDTLNGSKGIYVGGDAANATVRNVTVRNASGRAVVLRGPNATVTGTRILDAGTRGVLVAENGGGVGLLDTTVRRAGTKGLRIQRNATLENVTVRNATEDGINVELGATVAVANSTVADSGASGVWVEPGDVTVENTTVVRSGGQGIIVERSGSDLTLRHTTTRDAADWDLAVRDGVAADLARVSLGPSTGPNSTVGGVAEDVRLRAVEPGTEPAPPAGRYSPEFYVETNATTPDGSLDLRANYGEAAAAGLNESSFRVWRYDDSWAQVGGLPDPDANTVTATVSDLSTVAVLGELAPATFEVTVDSTTAPVPAGETVSVNATVRNTGGTTDTRDVTLEVAGAERDRQSVTLPPDGSAAVTLDWATTLTDVGTVTATVATQSDQVTTNLTITDETDPTADAGPNVTAGVNESVTLDGSGSSDNDAVDSYEWDLDDDGTTDATGQSITHSYGAPGEYTVTLTVTDPAGNTDTDTLTVTVVDETAPTAEAGPNVSAVADVAVEFDAAGSEDNVGIVAYEWAFGDGANATRSAASHTYATVGEYTVTLTVRDAAGNEATDTLNATVSDPTLSENWSYATDGRAQDASPAVGPDRVFVGGLDDTLHAVYRANGSAAWTFDRAGSLSDSSPAYDSGTVYVGSGGGVVYALSAAGGATEWTYSTDSAVVSSPTVANGTVYVGSNDGTVLALDAVTGSVDWTRELGSPVLSTPAVSGGRVFVTADDGRLFALDAATGATDWQFDAGDAGHASPTVRNGSVYVAAGALSALDATDGSVQWQRGGLGAASTPLVASGTVYVGATDGTVWAWNATDGAPTWNHSAGGTVAAKPAVLDGRVIVAATDGTVSVLDPTSGTGVAGVDLGSPTRSSPVVVGDTVSLGTRDGRLVVLDYGAGAPA